MAHVCYHKGHKEKCLLKGHKRKRGHVGADTGKYPITKNGKLNCNRVRNALARGAQQGKSKALKRAGIGTYMKRCKIDQ